MSTDRQSDIMQFIPKELADPRTQTIYLKPLKAMLEQKELEYQNTIKEFENEVKRLKEDLETIQRTYANIEYLRIFYEKLELYCFHDCRKIHLLQCSANIKRGECSGLKCPNRRDILEKLGVKPR